ncbi:MAG: spermidine synthase [Pseudomonadota bacterium]|nr:spermidine synthase [Pseudomonadota bacterium]
MTQGTERSRIRLFYLVVMLSGLAGLGYQMVWTRLLAVSLGHEIVAVMAVVAAFFVGLALGGLVLNNVISRSRRPQYWYLGLELAIALWSLLLTQLIPVYNQILPTLIGTTPSGLVHWSYAFGASLLLLLPATFAMGATLPALERVMSAHWRQPGKIPALYSANTFGAVLGTLFATFLLIPELGLSSTQVSLAVVNILCALAVPMLLSQQEPVSSSGTPSRSAVTSPSSQQPPQTLGWLYGLAFCTGLLGIGYEITVVRVLSQILENTVYSFASVLAVYLIGVACGSWLYQHRLGRATSPASTWQTGLQRLLSITATLCLTGIGALWLVHALYPALSAWLSAHNISTVLAELVVATLVFLPPTLAMGALFSHLASRATQHQRLGNLLGWNTLGSAVAPGLFGVMLLPLLGAKTALAMVPMGYLLLVLAQWFFHRASLPRPTSWRNRLFREAPVALCLTLLLLMLPFPLRFITVPEQSQIIDYREGVMAAVAVVEDASGHRHLKVNNHFTMGGTASRFSDHRQSHLPLLLHGQPRQALYLGLGTGITYEASQYYPDLTTTAVELLPEAVELMPSFGVTPAHWPNASTVMAADARRFVLSSAAHYDVIIAEIFHPSRDGAGALYTREHFTAVRERLADDGLFAQWLPLFQLDLDTLKTIIRTFVTVFPDAQLHLGHLSLEQPILCLVGTIKPRPYHADWLLQRVHDPRLQQQLVLNRLNSDFALFGGFLGDSDAMRQFVGAGPINTDDHPLVNYRAPNFVYQPQSHPSDRLMHLLATLSPQRGNLLTAEQRTSPFATELEKYWQARDAFIRTGTRAQDSHNVQQLLARSREPLLQIVRSSDEFDPAYRTLLVSARNLAAVDPAQAFDLLTELDSANPQQPEARLLRQRLFGR